MNAPNLPAVGSLFAGRYRIQGLVGQGSMGVVLAARDERTGVDCALKVLVRAEIRADAARVVREGRALMLISSPHVVRVFDVAEAPDLGPYLVLERLEGRNLAQAAPLGKKWPWRVVVDYASQICTALVESHAAGIVHRDVKLSNVFLAKQRDGSEVVKVLDFGIAKVTPAAGSETSTITKETILGSPQYMSPEQLANPRAVDGRTDLWSLGIIMYRLLGGAFPFNGASVVEVSTSVVKGDVPPLAASDVAIPPDLQRLLDRCLAKRPEERIASAAELRAALARIGEPEPAPAPAPASPASPTGSWRWVGLAAAVVVLGGALAAFARCR